MLRNYLFIAASFAALAQQSGQYYLVETHPLPPSHTLRDGDSHCPELPAQANVTALAATDIIKLLGNPAGFSFGTLGARAILIYYTGYAAPTTDPDQKVLAQIRANIDALAALRYFSIELSVPHSSALGDLATRIGALGYSQFTVADAGPGRIRVTAEEVPECLDWKRFLDGVRRTAWQAAPAAPVQKVFYLDAAQLSTALGSSPAQATPGGSTPLASPVAKAITAPTAPSAPTPPPADKPASPAATAPKPAKPVPHADAPAPPVAFVAAKLASSDVAQGGGAKDAGAKAGGAQGGGAKAGGTQGGGAQDGGAAAGAAKAGGAKAGGTQDAGAQDPGAKDGGAKDSGAKDGGAKDGGQQASPNAVSTSLGVPGGIADLLIFNEPTPGDDGAIHEKKRIVAALDLPRPELLVNVWSVQASSTDPAAVRKSHDGVLQLVTRYNERLEGAVFAGWDSLKSQMNQNASFFEEHFYKYVAYHHVADMQSHPPSSRVRDSFERESQDILDGNSGAALSPATRERLGICPADQYCLGYSQLFRPLKPRLTDMLLTVVAAEHPRAAADLAITAMENLTAAPPTPESATCEAWDYPEDPGAEEWPTPRFECFRSRVHDLLETAGHVPPSSLGILRAAIADFLFNYKMSQQYPHEFSAYNLSQSAQALNAALDPLVEGFERDVAAYQNRLRGQVEAKRKHGDLGTAFKPDKSTFLNSGLVTVRTISGKETIVDTISQSYLDTTTAPSLSDVINAVGQAGGSSSPIPLAISKNLAAGPASAMIGALGAMQPSQSKIGREFKIDLTPRTLPGAASAEIDISMNVGESAEPSRFTGSSQTQGNDNLSRVATHNTTTKVRIDSLKLFDVSSFTAVLSRSRSRIPLLPLPFVEMPYVGTLVGWPRSPAKEYHSSIGVLSALVVPTAADLAYGLAFVSDRVFEIDPDRRCTETQLTGCLFRTSRSIRDLNDEPVNSFHRAMVNCLSTGLRAAYTRMAIYDATPQGQCTALKFDDLERDAN